MKTELEKKLMELLSNTPVMMPDGLSQAARAEPQMMRYFAALKDWLPKARAATMGWHDVNDERDGWWIVDGIRHSARVRARTEAEAIKKAEEAGVVADLEMPTAKFWTKNLPDAF